MTQRGIANHTPVKIECGNRCRRGYGWMTGRIGELAATTPDLKREVVEGVVSVGECGEDGAVAAGIWIGEEAGDLFEFHPCGGGRKLALNLRTKSGLKF